MCGAVTTLGVDRGADPVDPGGLEAGRVDDAPLEAEPLQGDPLEDELVKIEPPLVCVELAQPVASAARALTANAAVVAPAQRVGRRYMPSKLRRSELGSRPYRGGMERSDQLTHVDARGAARMVDVTAKAVTQRAARAQGRLVTTPEVIGLLRQDGLPKGDALAVARIAGIAGAKRASDVIPLCHPIALHGVTVDLELGERSVTITATTRTADRTGVEMEALTAVAAAGLTLYDMVKAVDRGAVLAEIRLLAKSGGRSGEWSRLHEPGAQAVATDPSTPAEQSPVADPSDQAEEGAS